MSQLVMTIDDFRPLGQGWGSPVEREVSRRIHLSVATYAYEIADAPFMTDAMWDVLASQIDRWMPTGHPLLDEFFLAHFSPMTGMWIHEHPELDGIQRIYERYHAKVLSQLGR